MRLVTTGAPLPDLRWRLSTLPVPSTASAQSTGPGGRALVLAAVLAAIAATTSCRPRQPEPPRPLEAVRGPALRFAYTGIDGRPISTESMTNRVSVIGFLTTYDVPSQVVARFLAMLERRHTPRINVAVLMLEAPENRPLVEAFATSLGLRYPIALADAATIAGEAAFSGLHHVPSVVILDRAGREAWRRVGFVDEATLEAAVRAVEAASPAPSEDRAAADGG